MQSTDAVPEPVEVVATVDEAVVGPLVVVVVVVVLVVVVDATELVVPVVLPGPVEVVVGAPPAPPLPS